MTTNTDELKLYKRALRDYLLSYVFSKKLMRTEWGFCDYFAPQLNMYMYGLLAREVVPTLWSLKPDNEDTFWFPPGELWPRIKLLWKAIRILQKT